MKAEELRIGNIITAGKYKAVEIVMAIFGPDVLLQDTKTNEEWQPEIADCAGIPLTEEWLLRFGFEHHAGQREYFRHENISLLEFLDQGAEFRIFLDDGTTLCFIKYVHQLQNLYFALTGEELTIQ